LCVCRWEGLTQNDAEKTIPKGRKLDPFLRDVQLSIAVLLYVKMPWAQSFVQWHCVGRRGQFREDELGHQFTSRAIYSTFTIRTINPKLPSKQIGHYGAEKQIGHFGTEVIGSFSNMLFYKCALFYGLLA
jgi:hypothetical protein